MLSTAVANKQGVVHECGGRRGGRGGNSCCGNVLSGGVVVNAALLFSTVVYLTTEHGSEGPSITTKTLERKTTNHRRRPLLTLLLSLSLPLLVAVVVGVVACGWLWWMSVVAQCLGKVVALILTNISLTLMFDFWCFDCFDLTLTLVRARDPRRIPSWPTMPSDCFCLALPCVQQWTAMSILVSAIGAKADRERTYSCIQSVL